MGLGRGLPLWPHQLPSRPSLLHPTLRPTTRGLIPTLTVISSDTQRTAAAGVLAGLVLVLLVTLLPRIARDLRLPVLVYSLTIFTMAVTATAIRTNRQQVLMGALLFTASDSILATDRFLVSPSSLHRSTMQYAVWTLYYTGQLLIALGF